MTRELAIKASQLLLAIEELERLEDMIEADLCNLEDNRNYQDLTAPIQTLIRSVKEQRQRELEAL